MDIRLDDEQKLLQSTFTRFLSDRCPLERVRELEAGAGHDRALWSGLAGLGALGLLIPERYGGLDGSFVEAALLCEAIGGALYPSPFLWTCVVAPLLIAQLGDQAARATWLPRIAEGSAIIALVDDRAHEPAAARLRATPGTDGYRLSGVAQFVEHAGHADALLVIAEAPDGLAMFLLPADRPGLSLVRRHEISGGQFYQVTFDHLLAPEAERLIGNDSLDEAVIAGVAEHADAGSNPRQQRIEIALNLALDRARVALAARMVGAAQRAFDLTLRYTRERSQFGQPLLRFQALNFRLAALLTRIDAARLLAYHAAWLLDQGQEFAHAALFAKVQASEVYREMAAEAIQIHGGFGFTAEANPQLFYRRAASDAMLLGSATALRERIAGYLDLG